MGKADLKHILSKIFLCVFVIAGFVLIRVQLLDTGLGGLNHDEAMVGFHAYRTAFRNIHYVFATRMVYNGGFFFDTHLLALIFRLFDVSRLTCKSLAIFEAGITVLLLFYFMKKHFGLAPALSAYLLALFPGAFFTIWNFQIRGHGLVGLFNLLVVAWLFFYMDKARPKIFYDILFGFFSGLAFLNNASSLLIIALAAIVLVWKKISQKQNLAAVLLYWLGGFILGALPKIVWDFQNHFQHASWLWTAATRGVHPPWLALGVLKDDLLYILDPKIFSMLFLGAVILNTIIILHEGVRKMWENTFLICCTLLYLFIICASGAYDNKVYYLYFSYPFIYAIIALPIQALVGNRRLTLKILGGVYAICFFCMIIFNFRVYLGFHKIVDKGGLQPDVKTLPGYVNAPPFEISTYKLIEELVRSLDKNGILYVIGDGDIIQKINFYSKEKIVSAPGAEVYDYLDDDNPVKGEYLGKLQSVWEHPSDHIEIVAGAFSKNEFKNCAIIANLLSRDDYDEVAIPLDEYLRKKSLAYRKEKIGEIIYYYGLKRIKG